MDFETLLKKTLKGIAYVESRGTKNPYTLISAMTTTGMYKGDRAYGKYQIMGMNIPSWTKEATGTKYTKEQFLGNPEIQEKTAAYWTSRNLKKYGTMEDAWSMWFSGRPMKKAGNARDVYGTTVPQYIKIAKKGSEL